MELNAITPLRTKAGYQNTLVIPIQLAGKRTIALVDSGASISTISHTQALALKV